MAAAAAGAGPAESLENHLYERVADGMMIQLRDRIRADPDLDPELRQLITDTNNGYAALALNVAMRPKKDHDVSWRESPMLNNLLRSVFLNIDPNHPGLAEKRPKFEENLTAVFKKNLTSEALRNGVLEALSRDPTVRGFARGSKFEHKYAPPAVAPSTFPSPEYAAGAPPSAAPDIDLEKVVDQVLADNGIPKGAQGIPNRGYERTAGQFGKARRRTKKSKRTRRRRLTSRRA